MPAMPLVLTDAVRASQAVLERLLTPLGSCVGTTALDDEDDGVPVTPAPLGVHAPETGVVNGALLPVVKSVVWSRVTWGGRICAFTLSKVPREFCDPMPIMPLLRATVVPSMTRAGNVYVKAWVPSTESVTVVPFTDSSVW